MNLAAVLCGVLFQLIEGLVAKKFSAGRQVTRQFPLGPCRQRTN
jgi:hypothetical protein